MFDINHIKLLILMVMVIIQSGYNSGNNSLLIKHVRSDYLHTYRGYATLSVIHFKVPINIESASFRFEAKIEHLCGNQSIMIYMKRASIPVVNFDHTTLPAELIVSNKMLYNLRLTIGVWEADWVKIKHPVPGYYYAVAYLDNEDQECGTTIDAYLFVKRMLQRPIHIDKRINLNRNFKLIDLVQIRSDDQFEYAFKLPKRLGNTLRLRKNKVSIVRFHLTDVFDTGGTLLISLTYKRTKQHSTGKFFHYTPNHHMIHAYLAMDNFHPLNETSAILLGKNINHVEKMVPYPDAGDWFLTLRLSCHRNDEMCAVLLRIDIKSVRCIDGTCGVHGTCVNDNSGAVAFSTCLCDRNYKGFACLDYDPREQVSGKSNTDVFLLLISACSLIIPSHLATLRHYYIASSAYLLTLAFTSCFHICFAHHALCPAVPLYVFEYAETFATLTSIWVTFVTISGVWDTTKEVLYNVGVILIALLATQLHELPKLLLILLPSGVGMILCISQWITLRLQQVLSRYWFISLPMGIVLLMAWMVIVSLLETAKNYAPSHSCAHVLLAASFAAFLTISQNG